MICGMWNVANERQPFGTRGKITEGSPNEPGYEPEDKANERNRNKSMHAVDGNLAYQSKNGGL